jgi:hypothetical protein
MTILGHEGFSCSRPRYSVNVWETWNGNFYTLMSLTKPTEKQYYSPRCEKLSFSCTKTSETRLKVMENVSSYATGNVNLCETIRIVPLSGALVG